MTCPLELNAPQQASPTGMPAQCPQRDDAPIRIGLFGLGAALLFGYDMFLNLAPLEFREVVGLYIATLFVVWQVINYLFFRTVPTLPILIGGTLIVAGGAVVSFWKA